MKITRLYPFLLALACVFGAAHRGGAAVHPAQNWTQVAPATQNDELRDLVEGGGDIIAVTSDPSGTVLRSTDGVSFVREPLGVPGTGPLDSLLWHNGQWHAVRGGILHRKASGGNWETVAGAPARIVGLASEMGELWAWTFGGFDYPYPLDAVRVFPTLWRKADGQPWTQVTPTPPGLPAIDYSSLIHRNGLYVLTGNGYDFDLDDYTGGIWTSADGVTWETSAYGNFRSTAWNGTRFVAGSYSGHIAYCEDGVTWFEGPFPFIDGSLGGVGGFEDIPSPARSITWFNNAFWVVTSTLGEPHLAKSDDGTVWTKVLAGYQETLRGPTREIRIIGGVPYFLGGQGYLWKAAQWEVSRERLLPTEPAHWRSVAANATTLIAVGEGGRFARSADALSFTYGTLDGALSADAVVWIESAHAFVAVGRAAGADGLEVRAWRSADGVAWQPVTVGTWPQGQLGLAAGPDGAMVCGPAGNVAFSADGAAWDAVSTGFGGDLWAAAYGGGRWVAAGPAGDVIHSSDRVAWHHTEGLIEPRFVWNAGVWYFANRFSEALVTADFSGWSPVENSSLPGNDALFAAFGEIFGNEDRFLGSSADGFTWFYRSDVNPAATPKSNMTAGTRFRDRIVYAGRDGRIHRSAAWRNFYEEWRQLRFPAGQQNIEAISGPQADPDGDGAPNAVEYACGLNPLLPDARTAIGFDFDTLSFYYPRSASAPGVGLVAEFSENLHDWRRTGLMIGSTGDDFIPDLVRVWASPTGGPYPRAFFRLRAIPEPPIQP